MYTHMRYAHGHMQACTMSFFKRIFQRYICVYVKPSLETEELRLMLRPAPTVFTARCTGVLTTHFITRCTGVLTTGFCSSVCSCVRKVFLSTETQVFLPPSLLRTGVYAGTPSSRSLLYGEQVILRVEALGNPVFKIC